MEFRRKLLILLILFFAREPFVFAQEDEEFESGIDPDVGAVTHVLEVTESPPQSSLPAGQETPLDPATAENFQAAANPQGQAKLKDLGIDEGAQALRRDILTKINSGDRKGMTKALASARGLYPDDPAFIALEKLTKVRMTRTQYDRIIAKTLKEGQKLFGIQVTLETPALVRPGSRFFGRDVLTRAYAQINRKNDIAAEKILTAAIAQSPGHAIFHETRGVRLQRFWEFLSPERLCDSVVRPILYA